MKYAVLLLLLTACAKPQGESIAAPMYEPGFQPHNQCCDGTVHCTKHIIDDGFGQIAYACFAPTENSDLCQVCYKIGSEP